MSELKKTVIALGQLFGVSIYRLKQGKTELEKIPEELSLVVPAKFHTVESLLINKIETAHVHGGTKVVLVNGGKTATGEPLSFPTDAVFEEVPGDSREAMNKWYPNLPAVVEMCNAFNDVERQRLETVILNLKSQIGELDRIDSENESRLAEVERASKRR